MGSAGSPWRNTRSNDDSPMRWHCLALSWRSSSLRPPSRLTGPMTLDPITLVAKNLSGGRADRRRRHRSFLRRAAVEGKAEPRVCVVWRSKAQAWRNCTRNGARPRRRGDGFRRMGAIVGEPRICGHRRRHLRSDSERIARKLGTPRVQRPGGLGRARTGGR